MISFLIKRLFNFSVLHLFFSADVEEFCQSQPVYSSSLSEKDTQSNHNETGGKAFSGKQAASLLVDNGKFTRTDAEKKTSFTDGTQKSRSNRVRRGMMAGPIANTSKVMNSLFSSQMRIDPMFITLHIHYDLWLLGFFLRIHTKEDLIESLRLQRRCSEKTKKSDRLWLECLWLT